MAAGANLLPLHHQIHAFTLNLGVIAYILHFTAHHSSKMACFLSFFKFSPISLVTICYFKYNKLILIIKWYDKYCTKYFKYLTKAILTYQTEHETN